MQGQLGTHCRIAGLSGLILRWKDHYQIFWVANEPARPMASYCLSIFNWGKHHVQVFKSELCPPCFTLEAGSRMMVFRPIR